MHSWQHIRHISLCTEYITSILLIILAVLLVAPAIHNLTSTAALDGKTMLAQRLQAVIEQARADGCPYTVTFKLHSSQIRVVKWSSTLANEYQVGRIVVKFSQPLPSGVLVENSTLPGNEVTISENGFILSTGRIVLCAGDGSRVMVEIGSPESDLKRNRITEAEEKRTAADWPPFSQLVGSWLRRGFQVALSQKS